MLKHDQMTLLIDLFSELTLNKLMGGGITLFLNGVTNALDESITAIDPL